MHKNRGSSTTHTVHRDKITFYCGPHQSSVSPHPQHPPPPVHPLGFTMYIFGRAASIVASLSHALIPLQYNKWGTKYGSRVTIVPHLHEFQTTQRCTTKPIRPNYHSCLQLKNCSNLHRNHPLPCRLVILQPDKRGVGAWGTCNGRLAWYQSTQSLVTSPWQCHPSLPECQRRLKGWHRKEGDTWSEIRHHHCLTHPCQVTIL